MHYIDVLTNFTICFQLPNNQPSFSTILFKVDPDGASTDFTYGDTGVRIFVQGDGGNAETVVETTRFRWNPGGVRWVRFWGVVDFWDDLLKKSQMRCLVGYFWGMKSYPIMWGIYFFEEVR